MPDRSDKDPGTQGLCSEWPQRENEMNPIREEIQGYMTELVPFRREIHRHPELSLKEFGTTERISRELDKLGVKFRRMEPTGICGEISGALDGKAKTILVREDIDALPVEEKTGLPFASEEPGKMHACGHDIHMTILLGAIRYLHAHRDVFSGTIRFLFQPAEECSQGAAMMIRQGVMEGVDHAVGMHISPFLPYGKVSALHGECWAACDRFRIRIQGKRCHGAMPHTGRDALLCAAAVVMNLQQIVSRETEPGQAAVVTVGSMHAGSAYNIVAGEAELEGTCRTYAETLHKMLPEKIRRISENTAEAFGCTAQVDFQVYSESLYNDPGVTKQGLSSAEKVLGEGNAVQAEQQMIAEDFSFYSRLVPSVFFNIGARVEEDEKVRPLHSDEILFDERAIETGASVLVQTVLDLLGA